MNEDKNNNTDEEEQLCYEQNQTNNHVTGEDIDEQEPSTYTNRKATHPKPTKEFVDWKHRGINLNDE